MQPKTDEEVKQMIDEREMYVATILTREALMIRWKKDGYTPPKNFGQIRVF